MHINTYIIDARTKLCVFFMFLFSIFNIELMVKDKKIYANHRSLKIRSVHYEVILEPEDVS